MSTTHRAAQVAAEPPPFTGWDGLTFVLVCEALSKLTKARELLSSSRVCRAWSNAVREDAVWEHAVVCTFPASKFKGIFASFERLGVTGWKSRYRLLSQRSGSEPPARPERGWGFDDLQAKYTFFVAVADEDGNVVSREAMLWMSLSNEDTG